MMARVRRSQVSLMQYVNCGHVSQSSQMCVVPGSQNLLQNGDFETGSFDDWTASATAAEVVSAYSEAPIPTYGFRPPARGIYGATVSSGTTLSLSQTVYIPPKNCTLSFWESWTEFREQTLDIFYRITIDSPPGFSGVLGKNVSSEQDSWSQWTWPFMGDGENDTLTLTFQNPGSGYWWVDDVSITCSEDDYFGKYGETQLHVWAPGDELVKACTELFGQSITS